MLRLSKKIEYALLALQHMTLHETGQGNVYTVKEMSEHFGISFDLLAKVMSRLAKHGIVKSTQGVNGGFIMAKPAHEVTIYDVIVAIEGLSANLVECGSHPDLQCTMEGSCGIKHPLMRLQSVINNAMASMAIADLHERSPRLVDLELIRE